MGFCGTHAKEKGLGEQQQAKNAKCSIWHLKCVSLQCKNFARTSLLGWARGMCFKHAKDAECKMPKQKKNNNKKKPGVKQKAKKENKPMQGDKNDKNAIRYPGGWSDAVMMTGHHKNATSQVE